MTAARDIRVLVVQHFPVARYGSAHFLDAQEGIRVVGMASTGKEAIALAHEHQPDVVVSNLEFPDMSGVAVMSAIRSEHPDIRFVVMTSFRGDDSIYRAIDAGAQAYLTKDMPLAELVNAVTRVHEGELVLPAPIEKTLSRRLPNSDLTPREREVLNLIANGMTNKQIAHELNIAEGTVKGYVNSIFRQLGASSRTEAVAIGARRGIAHITSDTNSLTSTD